MNVTLDRRVTFDRKVETVGSRPGAPDLTYEAHVTVWAQRRDERPSRSESLRQGLELRRSLVFYTVRWRNDLDSSMRMREAGRTYQIVGGPAEIGRKEYLELACEEISTDGGA